MPAEDEVRAALIAEARSWLRTPWHHEARLKGVGVDCAQLLVGVYVAVGLIEPPAIEHYPADWHLHRGDQKFLSYLLRYARKVDEGKPGDIAMFSYGRADAHGALVVDWPSIIHANVKTRLVQSDDAARDAAVVDAVDRLHGEAEDDVDGEAGLQHVHDRLRRDAAHHRAREALARQRRIGDGRAVVVRHANRRPQGAGGGVGRGPQVESRYRRGRGGGGRPRTAAPGRPDRAEVRRERDPALAPEA